MIICTQQGNEKLEIDVLRMSFLYEKRPYSRAVQSILFTSILCTGGVTWKLVLTTSFYPKINLRNFQYFICYTWPPLIKSFKLFFKALHLNLYIYCSVKYYNWYTHSCNEYFYINMEWSSTQKKTFLSELCRRIL